MSNATARCLWTIRTYANNAGGGLKPHQLQVQADRASSVAARLRKERATVVLDDPVGTGKTVVALAAAKELMSRGRVTKVLVISPNEGTAARWRERVELADMAVSSKLKKDAVHVCTTRQLGQLNTTKRESLLVIIDEAHRGLHKHTTQAYARVSRVARGARVMLVTATPFQLSATGLIRMLTVGLGGPTQDHERLQDQAQAAADLIRIEHEISLGDGKPSLEQKRREAAARQSLRDAAGIASRAREAIFLPRYPRKEMGMPEKFRVPHATPVKPGPEWLRAYHVARLVPDLVPKHGDGDRVHNSDAFMRELVSSHGALTHSKAWRSFVEHADGSKEGRRLRKALTTALFSHPHPKVEQTARLAVKGARSGRHVLVFCYFTATPDEVRSAVRAHAPDITVKVARNEKQAKEVHGDGFRNPTSAGNSPIVLIVGEALSESVDLDGGKPVVIHHDLSWSPVRFDQRMGRVVRASTGFQKVADKDVIIPVLAGGIDQRMYDTLKNRRRLASEALAWADDPDTLEY